MADQSQGPINKAMNLAMRKALALVGVGQGEKFGPLQDAIVALWKLIRTMTTPPAVKAKNAEAAPEESAEQEPVASGGAGGPDLTPTPLGPTPLPFPPSLAQEQAALRAVVAERQGQAEGNQGESLEQEFERFAAPFRQAQEAQGQSLPPMENDADAVIAGAIEAELGGGLPPAANDNYSSTARNIAGYLLPGRDSGDNDNGDNGVPGTDGASQQPEDNLDVLERLKEIAAVAEQEGPDNQDAIEKMQALLNDCQHPEKMNMLFLTAAKMKNHYLDAVVGIACLDHIEKAAASNE
jgi:hypothetical protein